MWNEIREGDIKAGQEYSKIPNLLLVLGDLSIPRGEQLSIAAFLTQSCLYPLSFPYPKHNRHQKHNMGLFCLGGCECPLSPIPHHLKTIFWNNCLWPISWTLVSSNNKILKLKIRNPEKQQEFNTSSLCRLNLLELQCLCLPRHNIM